MRERWSVRLLGGLEVRRGAEQPIRFRTHKAALLLARLAVTPGRSFGREELIEELWPDADPEAARHNLRQALSSLRSSLEPLGTPSGSVLDADRVRVRLVPESVSSDVAELEGGNDSPAGYPGELLPGYTEDWVVSERRRIDELYWARVLKHVQILQKAGQVSAALPFARMLVASNPLDEAAQGLLIRLLADAGRAEEAVQQYREYRQVLRKELGEEPDPKIRELAMTLKGAAGKIVAPTDTETRVSAQKKSQLPQPLTRLFGREEELQSLRRLVEAGSRLITLTGPGGSGKTRLAVETARSLINLFDGRVWYVPLADVRDHGLLLGRILESVGEKPRQGTSLIAAVAEAVGDGKALFVLDNLEQLLPEAVHPIQSLLSTVPDLAMICTSRGSLRIPGERAFPVELLPVPDSARSPSDLSGNPSAELFYDRASQAAPGFRVSERNAQAVATLCRQLEGLPLAIELAAAWSGTLTPGQMVEKLSHRFELLKSSKLGKEERHASLWAAIDWSFSMLRPETQEIFERLAVFRGGWDLEAAREVCEIARLEEALEELRSHALIFANPEGDEMRWGMLESLREFGEAHLQAADLAAASNRHAQLFARRAHEWHELQRGADQERINRRFADEIDNFWAVIDRGIDRAVPLELAYRVVNGAYRFWEMRGAWAAMRRAYERLIEADIEKRPTKERALALVSVANLMRQQGEPELAIEPTLECLNIREQLGDRAGVSSALGHLGQVHKALGNSDEARSLYIKCLEIQKDIGANWSWAMNCMNLGWLLVLGENWDEAEEWLSKARAEMLELEDKWGVAASTGNLGEVAVGKGELDRAGELHAESLRSFQEIGDLPAMAEELEAIAHLAFLRKEIEVAARLYGAAEGLRNKIGSPLGWQEAARLAKRKRMVALASEHFEGLTEEGERMTAEVAIDIALLTIR